MNNFSGISYSPNRLLAKIMLVLGFLGLITACEKKYIPDDPLPEVEGCKYRDLSVIRDAYGVAMVCDSVHDLERVESNYRIIEIEITEKVDVSHLDLSGFQRLRSLEVNNDNIKTLHLKDNDSLQNVELAMAALTELELPSSIRVISFLNAPALSDFGYSELQFHILKLSGSLGFDVNDLLAHPTIETLHLSKMRLDDLNLSQMENLTDLHLIDCEYEELQLPENADLALTIEEGNLTEWDIPAVPLKGVVLRSTPIRTLGVPDTYSGYIDVLEHDIESLYVSGQGSVRLSIFDSSIGVLDVAELPLLQSLLVRRSEIEHLDLVGNGALTSIVVHDTLTAQISLPPDAPIAEISLQDLLLSDLTIPGYDSLERLSIANVPLAQLSVDTLNNLRELNLKSTLISEIPLGAMPNLEDLGVAQHRLLGLDLSDNQQLKELYLCEARGFTELDLSHLDLTWLSISASDLSQDSQKTIRGQFSKLGGAFHLSSLSSCG